MKWRAPLALAGILALVLCLANCDKLECGPGTHQEGEQCVAHQSNLCGPGTVSHFGVCIVPDAAALPEVQCDTAAPPDTGEKEDVAQDTGPPSLCPGEPIGSSYCISGRLVEVMSNETPDIGAVREKKFYLNIGDAVKMALNPAGYKLQLTEADLNDDGTFVFTDVPFDNSDTQIIIVVGEADAWDNDTPGTTWIRVITGIPKFEPGIVKNYEHVQTWMILKSTKDMWNTATGYDGDLEEDGFWLGTIVDQDSNPIDGATLPPVTSAMVVYYLSDDLESVVSGDQTSASGKFIVPKAPISTSYQPIHPNYDFAKNLGGTSGGAATTSFLFGTPK